MAISRRGIASEAASLAGHLRLDKLTVLYDDNHIQLDGPTDMAWSEDVLGRFEAYHWGVLRVTDGNDLDAIEAAIRTADGDGRPSIIAVRTHIGYGAPNKQDTQKAHGSPLGEDEVRLAKEFYGWDPDAHFLVPPEVLDFYRVAIPEGQKRVDEFHARFEAYAGAYADEAADLRRRIRGDLRPDALEGLKSYAVGEELATRQVSQQAIAALAEPIPELFGGAADLSESNLTDIKGRRRFRGGYAGQEPPIRRSGARDGWRRERDRLPRRLHSVRRDIPQLQRLHARLGPVGRARGIARDLRLGP